MKVSKYKYHFYDIYIFEKHRNGYLSLSDLSFDDTLLPSYFQDLSFKSEYVIALPTPDGFSVSPITLEEILKLANLLPTSSFLVQLTSKIDKDSAKSVMAFVAAKRILEYRYGSVSLKPDPQNRRTVYTFTRYKKVKGHNQRHDVLEKSFERIEI